MKNTLALILATAVPARSFVVPDASASRRGNVVVSARSAESMDEFEQSRSTASSRRSFLNHVVTATTAGTLSTLSLEPQPALADATSSTALAGQIELPPMGLGAWVRMALSHLHNIGDLGGRF